MLLTECACCRAELPLSLPEKTEAGQPWACANCGFQYHSVLDESRQYTTDSLNKVRPPHVDFSEYHAEEVTDALKSFVIYLKGNPGQRACKLTQLTAFPIWVMPLNKQFQSEGKAFQIMLRGISRSEAVVLHTQPLMHNYYALRVEQDGKTPEIQVIGVIQNREPVEKFFEMEVKFLTRCQQMLDAIMAKS